MLAEKAEVVDTTTSPDAAPHSGASIPPKKRNGVLRGVLISLCSTVFTLAMVEGVFRVYQATAPKPFLFNVPPRDYLPESAFRARDFYYPPEKAPGVFRIIAIGDSFTFGGKMHFDDSYSKRLERMLNLNDKQRKVEVLNWGISGYSSFHEVQLVRTAITQFNPDLVIVQITLNDAELQPYRVTHRYQNKRGTVILKNPLFKYWTSLGYIVKRFYYTNLNKEYVTYHTAAFDDPKSWSMFSGAFNQMERLTSNRSIPLLTVLFPMMSHPFDENYPFHRIHKKIGDEMATQGIPFVDLFPDFKGRDPMGLQVQPGKDAHPNEIAHRLAADRIYTTLEGLNMIPDDVKIKRYSRRMLIKPYTVRPKDKPVGK